jgi:hypothetical protein
MAIQKKTCGCNNNLTQLKLLYTELTETESVLKPEDEACATELIDGLNKLREEKQPSHKLA